MPHIEIQAKGKAELATRVHRARSASCAEPGGFRSTVVPRFGCDQCDVWYLQEHTCTMQCRSPHPNAPLTVSRTHPLAHARAPHGAVTTAPRPVARRSASAALSSSLCAAQPPGPAATATAMAESRSATRRSARPLGAPRPPRTVRGGALFTGSALACTLHLACAHGLQRLGSRGNMEALRTLSRPR